MIHRCKALKYVPIMIFPVMIGTYVMYKSQIPLTIGMMNILCLAVLTIASLLIPWRKFFVAVRKRPGITLIAAAAVLLLPFWNEANEGVHRWISIGGFRVHAAMIVMPFFLISLGRMANDRWIRGFLGAVILMILLLLQPDASQVTGAGMALLLLFAGFKVKLKVRVILMSPILVMMVLSWIWLDHLAPVDYVEGILKMAREVGVIWMAAGVISIAILPLSFFLFTPSHSARLSRSIGLYYVGIMASTLFGSFPIPLLGYGVSPVIGIFFSLLWLSLEQRE